MGIRGIEHLSNEPTRIIETVYIFDGISEQVQLANAKGKAERHPDGFSNVCYHRQGESHNTRCYTFDINADDEEE